MSTTSLAILFKLLSIAGIVGHNNQSCPPAGTFISQQCVFGTATDNANVEWSGYYFLSTTFANGSCGTYTNQSAYDYGVCGFPPNGWSISYQPTYIWVDPIYWGHPNNPQCLQLAFAGGQFVVSSSNTYVSNWPETYTAGFSRSDGDLLQEITGVDGWRLRITYSAWNNGYNAVEDDLTPEGMP
jgi:hypothetical protein